MFLHGGPGRDVTNLLLAFQPDRYRVILFDQRGCGKSTPSAGDDDATPALSDNTTEHLIGDVSRLRRELNIHGKMHVFGAVGEVHSPWLTPSRILKPCRPLSCEPSFCAEGRMSIIFFKETRADFASNALATPVRHLS